MVYRSPGVYVEERPNPSFISLPNGVKIPAIVAPGNAVITVKNVAIVKGSPAGTDSIPEVDASDVRGITKIGDVPNYAQYIEGIDFNLVNGQIVWLAPGDEPDTGATYYVTYTKTKPDSYYEPITYYDIEDVREAHGQELIAGVVNPLTAGALLMFKNGAPAVMVVQAESGSDSDIQSAVDKLKAQEIDVLCVPGATNTTLQTHCRNHVLEQSSPNIKHERILVTGPTGLSSTISDITGRAVALSSERVILIAPPSQTIALDDYLYEAEQDVLLSSTYAGCALAGLLCNPNYDVAEPVTRKELKGIKDLSTHNYKETEMNALAGNGVCVLVDNAGIIRIRHGLTTSTANVNTATISVVSIKDRIRKDIRDLLEEAYIGTKILASTAASMSATIKAFLESKIADEIIVAYRNISVSQNVIDPRTMDVKFEFAAVYPLEYVDVSFSLYVG